MRAMTRCLVVASLAASALSGPARAGTFDDPRPAEWSRAWLDGDHERAIGLIKLDLESDHPHPLATWAWFLAHHRLDRTPEELEPTEQHRDRINVVLEVARLYYDTDDELAAIVFARENGWRDLADPFLVSVVNWAADNEELASTRIAAIARQAELMPDSCWAAWNFESLLEYRASCRDEIARVFAHGTPSGDTPAGALVRRLLELTPEADTDWNTGAVARIELLRGWLEDHPDDVFGQHRLGFLLDIVEHFEEAAALHASARTGFAFYYWSESLDPVLRLGRVDEAVRLSREWTGKPERQARLDVAARFLAIGRPGYARPIVDALMAEHPQWVGPHSLMARIELDAERPDHALKHARRAAELAPDSLAARVRLVRALRHAGSALDEARALAEGAWNEYRTSGRGYWARELLREHISILAALGEHRERLNVARRRGVDIYPESTSCLSELALAQRELGDEVAALATLDRLLELRPDSQWAMDRLVEWSGGVPERTDRARDRLESMRRQYPMYERIWNASAKLRADDHERLELYREAVAANPRRGWPISRAAGALADLDRHDEADALARGPFDPLGAGENARRLQTQIWALFNWHDHSPQPTADLEAQLVAWDEFRDIGGVLHWWHDRREEIYSRLGQKRLAALELEQSVRLDPSSSRLFELVTNYGREIGIGRTMSYQLEFVDWNPFETDRLRNTVKLKALYHGDPVGATRYANLLRDNRPDAYENSSAPSDLAIIYGRLGDQRAEFLGYRNDSSIGASQRYVDWYARARDAAMEQGYVDFDFDLDANTVTIEREDASVEVRGYHPVSGKPTLRQTGRAWLRGEYDDQGDNLVELRTSSGRTIRIDYDELDRIESVIDSDGVELILEYAPNGQLSMIGQRGVGAIEVTYNDAGEIVHTRSLDTHGQPAGGSVVPQIREGIGRYTSLVEQFERGDLTGLAPNDPVADALRARLADSPDDRWEAKATLSLAEHLVANVHLGRWYARDADELLDELWFLLGIEDDDLFVALAPRAATTWRQLEQAAYPAGMPAERLEQWIEIRSMLRQRLARNHPDTLQQTIEFLDAHPMTVAAASMWLPRHDLDNPGFWERWLTADVGRGRLDTDLQCVLPRRNGDLVVGTDDGLAVLRMGWWERLRYDRQRGRFLRDASAGDAASSILSLAESEDGSALWIGTANGLLELRSSGSALFPYDGPAMRYSTPDDGLPSARVDHVVAIADGALAGTPLGLGAIGIDDSWAAAIDGEIRFLSGFSTGTGDPEPAVLVGTRDGVFAADGATTRRLVEGQVDHAVCIPEDARLYVLDRNTVFAADWDGHGEPTTLIPLPGQGDIVSAGTIHRLAAIGIDGPSGRPVMAALTDNGLSFYRAGHFEHLKVPGSTSIVGVTVAAGSPSGDAVLLADDGVHRFLRGRVRRLAGAVHDLCTSTQWGKTFFASDAAVFAVDHATGEIAVFDDALWATHLALDAEQRLITNDGRRIIRYRPGMEGPEELFTAQPAHLPDGWPDDERITSLLVASDGAIWVSTGGSLFRWREGDDDADEFCHAVDPDRFPSRSWYITRVIERLSGEIVAIASNEGHLDYRGTSMIGGMVVYDPDADGFRRVTESFPNGAWFWLSYTPVSDSKAIVGTNRGFYIDTPTGLVNPADESSSYRELQRTDARLWLGARGASFGRELWLFGCARGLIGYRDGDWNELEQLNWLAPDQHLARWGSRQVNAVETDPRGRIYVGTPRGLLIYSRTTDPISFFVVNERADLASEIIERRKLHAQRQMILGSLDLAAAAAGSRAEQIRELHRIRAELERAEAGRIPLTTAADGEDADEARRRRREQTTRLREEETQALEILRREQPELTRLIEQQVYSIRDIQRDLPDGDQEEIIILQTMTATDALYLHVIKRDKSFIRVSRVPRDQLLRVARRAAGLLRTLRGRGITLDGAETSQSDGEQLREDLAQLYDWIILPIEHEIGRDDRLIYVPDGPLAIVPPSVMFRRDQGGDRFAVERFHLGVTPDLGRLGWSLRQDHRRYRGGLVFADPHGDLPHARDEGLDVQRVIDAGEEPLIGDDARVEALREYLSGRSDGPGVLHLAIHADFDEQLDGANSFLDFADEKVTFSEIANLDFRGRTALAVLSACETGSKAEGHEIGCLAGAFACAGIHRTIATLWRVEDKSSRELMQRFYEELRPAENGGWADHIAALTIAQRRMITRNGRMSNPALWAGYIAIGAPPTGAN